MRDEPWMKYGENLENFFFQKTIFFFSQIPAGGIYSVIFNGHLFSYLKVYEISVTPQS